MFENKFIFDLQRFDNEFVGGGEAAFSLNIDIKPSDEEAVDGTVTETKEVNVSEVNAPLAEGEEGVVGAVYNGTADNPVITDSSGTDNVAIEGLVVRKNSSGDTFFQVFLSAINELKFNGSADVTLSNGLTFGTESGADVDFNMNNGKFTGGSFKKGGRFSFGKSSLSDALYSIVANGVEIEATVAGTFEVGSDGDLETLALTEDGSVIVSNDYKFDFTDPTGTTSEVNIKNATGEYTISTNSGVTTLDISGLTATSTTSYINVAGAGGADYLIPPTALETIRVAGTTYAYDNNSGAAQFILNTSGAVTGFVFGGNNDVITVPKNASLTFYDEDGNTLDFGIAGSTQAYTVTRNADDQYAVSIYGSAVVSDSDTTLTFKTTRVLTNPVTVYFDDVGNILSVDGLTNLGTNDSMKVVESKTIESADGGLAIGNPDNPSGYISVGTGDFTYKNGVVSVESGDTVYSINGYNLAGTDGTIKESKIVDNVNGLTYNYKGKGYFVFDADNGITGFVFNSKNDYVQVPTGSNINLYYLTEATALTIPAIKDTEGYKVQLSNVSNATNPQFKISNISSDATVPTTAPLGAKLITEDTNDTLTIDLAGNIKAIDKLNSTITLASGTHDITINGNYLSYTSANKLTAVADGNNLVSVSGLTSSDVINAATNENIIFQFEVEGNAELNINGETYPVEVEGEGKRVVYITGGGENLATVSGIKAAKGVTINPSDKIITVAKSSLNKNTVTVDGDYSLELANNVATPKTKGAWSINTSTSKATYKETTSAGYSVEGNEIIYSQKETTNLVTVEGVKSVKGLSLNDDVVTVGSSSLKKANIKVSDGYTLALAEGVTESTNTGTWSIKNSVATYKQTTSAGYSLEDNEIIYSKKKTSNLLTVEGVKSVKGLSLNDEVVTVANSSLNKKNVTVSDGYTLNLAEDVTTPTSTGAWSLKDSTATYKASSTAGYSLADDGKSITYSKAKSATTLATVTGVKSVDGLSLKDNVITVANSSLNQGTVTVNDGYTLELADDVTKTSTTAKGWSLSDNVATYKTKETTAGYSVANNQISYTEASGGDTLVTVSGVKSIDGLTLKDNVVTVANSSLNNSNVTVSDGYTLKLAEDVTESTTIGEWSYKNSTATYEGSTTAGYTLAEDSQSITYSEEKSGETLATVKGVKSADGLTVNGTTITVSESSLNAKKVTLSGDGYTLKLDSDVTEPTSKNVSLTLKNSTATYTSSMTAGYTLAEDGQSITYSKATSGKTMATIKGVKSKSGISLKNDVVTLKNSALNNKVTVSGSYEFDFASDYKNATITGSSSADTISVLGANIKLNGGVGADSLSGGSNNDSINGGSGNDLIYGNKGADTLLGGAGNDSLWGGAGNDTLYGGAGNDTFIYKPGEGTDTIFDYQSGDMLQILKSNGSEGGTFSSSSFQNGNLTLGISGGGSVIFNGVSKSNSFNINGDTYKISGSKLSQK